MDVDYKFQVDYAKSGRAGCMKCKCSIPQDSFRIARLVQSPNFDGKIPRWFHFKCFFTKNTVINSTAEIKNFDSIRWEDQERIRQAMSGSSGEESKLSIRLSLPDMDCLKCKQDLLKERHMIVEGDVKAGKSYHLSCFLQSDACPSEIDTLNGFKRLKKVDQQAVLLAQEEAKKKKSKKRPAAKSEEEATSAKKAKTNEGEQPDQDALKKQSQQLWKLRDDLEHQVSKDTLIGLLEYNDQRVPTGLSNLLDAVSDAMMFGALATCPSCKKGPLYYSNGQYKCSAMATDWAPCLFFTRDPERVPFKVPTEYHDVDFLRTYKYKKRQRLFAADSDIQVQQKKPLVNLSFYVVGGPHRDGKTKEQVSEEVRALGASLSTKLTADVIVISSPSAWEQTVPRAKLRAERLGLRVVSDNLIDALADKSGLSETQLKRILNKHTISTWTVQEAPETKEKFKPPTQDDVMRVKFKGGAVVDPASGLESSASVLRDSRGTPLTAVLGMVDLVKGCNSFYRLQALRQDSGSVFYLFRAWGRIGTTIGGTKLEQFHDKNSVILYFEQLYLEKTGNEWCNRDKFEKKPHRFYEMELDYGETSEKTEQLKEAQSKPSKLHRLLQELIEFICDLDSMKEAMIEFEIDVKKMPLGKLSKRQIQEAYTILADLSKQLEQAAKSKAALDRTLLLSESTRFYTLIPHDFGMKTPPLLDSLKAIKTKLQMLEDLREIELAYNILSGDLDVNENPVDQHYRQLNTCLQPMDTTSEEFNRIKQYVKLTHGATHSSYKLQVVAVFDVERPEEKARFDGYTAARHNRQLLWHGSRRTNWVGILSQGLRIAPPEAPVTGYMFGKGIYFADMVSKSANYCFCSHGQPEGLLLLCEVILGDMHECKQANSSPLPLGMHSRKGVGSTTPDPSTYYTSPEGVLYPIGKPVSAGVGHTSLIYNEYIVYDVAQVKQKYLVRVKFCY